MTTTLTITRLHAYDRMTVHAPDEAASLLAGGCGCEDDVVLAADPAAWAVDPEAPTGDVTWHGVIGIEGEMTGDGRLIEPNALRWADLPIPLRYTPEDTGGHQGAVVVGRILTIERGANGAIEATGDIDMGSEAGREYARQVDSGLTPGISMDLDSVSFEVRVAKDLLDNGMMMLPMLADESDEMADGEDAGPTTDDEGRVTVMEVGAEDEVMVTTDARIRAATGVAIPAFAGARIVLDAPLPETMPEDAPALALVAASAPVEPPVAWFDNPGLTEPTPLTITEDGQVYGHLAVWGTCHTAYSGQCVEPPHSPSGYAYFRTGAVMTREGAEVPVGVITLDTLHAGRSLTAAQTLAHYENTGRGVADVSAGEDSIGIWIAGALRPGTSPEQVRVLRASPLSGDWRRMGGHLELMAALAVNVPGFPVPRPQGLVASGVMHSLVASGMLAPTKVIAPGMPGALTVEDLRYLKALAQRERQAEDEQRLGVQSAAADLAARVRATRVHAMARKIAARHGSEA